MPVVTNTVFASAHWAARELGTDEVPQLQAFFDANPGYFITVNGRQPRPDEAQTEFDEMPPPHLGFSRRWFLGLFRRDELERAAESRLAGVAMVVSDLGTAGVWHLALLFIDETLQGRGVAREVYGALEAWVRAQGAQWLRLGVIEGNPRAQRFWARQGFRAVRSRHGVDTGGRLNTVHVHVKPIAAEAELAAYLERVPRDRPGSALP